MASSIHKVSSPFLEILPSEIRLQIYSEVLSYHTLALYLTTTGLSLTLPTDLLALKLLALPLTCNHDETINLLYSTNEFTVKTPTGLRNLSTHVPSHRLSLIRHLSFTFPLPHLPHFSYLPTPFCVTPVHAPGPSGSASQDQTSEFSLSSLSPRTSDDPKNHLQPQDTTWLDSFAVLSNMKGLRKLDLELDVPVFWRRSWRDSEREMLAWIESYGLEVNVLVLGLLWDEKFDCDGEDEMNWDKGGKRNNWGKPGWMVERRERKAEEGNLWEREWGYLVDLGMSG